MGKGVVDGARFGYVCSQPEKQPRKMKMGASKYRVRIVHRPSKGWRSMMRLLGAFISCDDAAHGPSLACLQMAC
jgi:hypothetical protein